MVLLTFVGINAELWAGHKSYRYKASRAHTMCTVSRTAVSEPAGSQPPQGLREVTYEGVTVPANVGRSQGCASCQCNKRPS